MGSPGFCALVLSSWLASSAGVQQQRGHGGGWLRDDQPAPVQTRQAKQGAPGWSALAPVKRGCYAWMNNTCPQTRARLNGSAWWRFDARGSTSKKACNERVQSFDADCVDGKSSMLWVVGKEPKVPRDRGCYIWHPYGCPGMDPDMMRAQDKRLQEFDDWVLKEGWISANLESCRKYKALVDDECNASTMAVWVNENRDAFREGHVEFDDEMDVEETWKAVNDNLRSATLSGVAYRKSPNMEDMDKYYGLSWGETTSGRLTADGLWVHVKDVGFLPLYLNFAKVLEKKEVPCRDAREGDDCWQRVHWARTVGLPGHPDWYPGLTSSSSLREFQEVLHQNEGRCPMPCS